MTIEELNNLNLIPGQMVRVIFNNNRTLKRKFSPYTNKLIKLYKEYEDESEMYLLYGVRSIEKI
ncbi:MAG: hypothetical protein LBM96_06050 [Methanobrevibacter sp.]|jgi:hypothetical protein|nr:hypothetical protein [Candidatus Methanoflexus mossambicus]